MFKTVLFILWFWQSRVTFVVDMFIQGDVAEFMSCVKYTVPGVFITEHPEILEGLVVT